MRNARGIGERMITHDEGLKAFPNRFCIGEYGGASAKRNREKSI
jgi:hypothetical protein